MHEMALLRNVVDIVVDECAGKDVAAVRKMDCVLAVGALSKSEYNEKTYYDLDVDFIAVSGVKRGGASQDFSAPAGFDEIEELGDGELPF